MQYETAIRKLLRRVIAFHLSFVDITHSHSAAIFLSQAFFYECAEDVEKREFRGHGGGWWFHGYKDWHRDTRLTMAQWKQSRAICLAIGVLEERRGDRHGTLYFRLKLGKLLRYLNSDETASPKAGRKPKRAARVKEPTTLRVAETTDLRSQESADLRVAETSDLYDLEKIDQEKKERDVEESAANAASAQGAPAAPPPSAPAFEPEDKAPHNSGGVPITIQTYRDVHRRFPAKAPSPQQLRDGDASDWEQIVTAVLPEQGLSSPYLHDSCKNKSAAVA